MTGRIEQRGHQAPAAAPRSRRRGWSSFTALAAVAVVLAFGWGIVVSSLSLQAEAARADIQSRLGELTGLDVSVEGASSFTLLPRARLSLADINVGTKLETGTSDAVMHIDAIVADLDLWNALFGRATVERLTVVRPVLLSSAAFMLASTPSDAIAGGWDAPDAAAAVGKTSRVTTALAPASTTTTDPAGYLQMSRFFGAFLSRFGDLRSIDVRDGVFRVGPGSTSFGISNANLLVSWPSPSSSARMTGSYVWNGQPTEVDLRLASPLDFLGGGPSAVEFDMTSPPLTASFDGQGAIGGAGRFAGKVKIGTPSLTRSIRWLGDPRAILPEIGPMAIEATLEGIGRNLYLRDASVSLDGFVGEGAVEMMMADSGRSTLGGTLAFDRLDLTGFAQAVAPLPRNPLDLQRRISVDFVDKLDLDFRLSAARGSIGSLPISDLAATLKFKEGVGTLDVGDATVFGGRGVARLSVDSREAVPTAKGFASLSGVDSAGLFRAIGVNSVGVSGLSTLNAKIEAPVTNWSDLSKRARIALKVDVSGGALSGFDPNVFLGDGTKPFALATEPTAIPFETLTASLTSTGPTVDLETVAIKGSYGTFEASGTLSAATKDVDVSGSFTPNASSASAAGPDVAVPRPIGFRMFGAWPRPKVSSVPPGGAG